MSREHGGFIENGLQIASTLQCPHCGGHFISTPGSGIRRTFCTRCHAVTCGHRNCDECIPFEAKLDFVEGTKTSYKTKIEVLIKEGGLLI